MSGAYRVAGRGLLALMLVVWTCPAIAQSAQGKTAKPAQKPGGAYEDQYQRYLAAARAAQPAPDASIAWMTGLMNDPRARRVNDLVTIRVIESITASGKADSSVSKNSAATAGVPNLLGLEGKLPSGIDPSKLASLARDAKFSGAGATTRAGELTAVMTARVSEVLPNGDLVLEGVREIDINGDRQMVVLNGVVRPADILPNNVVLSTQIGQLSVRYFGNGLIRDSLKPGILVRLLNKVF